MVSASSLAWLAAINLGWQHVSLAMRCGAWEIWLCLWDLVWLTTSLLTGSGVPAPVLAWQATIFAWPPSHPVAAPTGTASEPSWANGDFIWQFLLGHAADVDLSLDACSCKYHSGSSKSNMKKKTRNAEAQRHWQILAFPFFAFWQFGKSWSCHTL